MGIVEELADALASDALAAADELEDERLVDDLGEVLLATSATTHEAYLTAVRVRRAARNGRQFLEKRIAEGKAG
jgi:hypothetical protein